MRLTYRDNTVPHTNAKGELWEAYSDANYNEVINKLAAYEDTGLEPDEIRENIGLLSPICIGCDGKTADGKRTEKCTYVDDDFRKCLERSVRLSKLAHAEEHGLLVRLPCKVGDMVYYKRRGWVCGDTVKIILFDAFGYHVRLDCEHKEFDFEDFGKTVFLTIKEAEAALKGGHDDGTA